MWQTAINPVIALELLAAGTWQGAGVLGPEAFDPVPFLDRLRGGELALEERARGSDRRQAYDVPCDAVLGPGPGRNMPIETA